MSSTGSTNIPTPRCVPVTMYYAAYSGGVNTINLVINNAYNFSLHYLC